MTLGILNVNNIFVLLQTTKFKISLAITTNTVSLCKEDTKNGYREKEHKLHVLQLKKGGGKARRMFTFCVKFTNLFSSLSAGAILLVIYFISVYLPLSIYV